MIKRVDHIAVAVKDLDEALGVLTKTFGFEAAHRETIEDQGVEAALIKIGDGEIELIQPIDPEGGVAKFIERRGEGIHHICLEVDSIDQELKSLAEKGVELIDKQPRKGLAGRIGFVHPRSTKGILIELAEKV